ncbi:MAG: quinolinate synthase NadA [Duncaniella sp.]|nr:quinolinate synthase NadA [Duncaniella sp.]
MEVENREGLIREIQRLKKERDAVILAHYYAKSEIQDIADFIGDSLALAQIASKLSEKVIVMCGVHFMGETVKILCPDKVVLVPDMEAGCSLADSCNAADFEAFIKEHPGHTVISYVNTSAAVKALTDIVVTSGNAMKVVESLPKDEKIIFGPDRNLGNYINSVTGRQMVLWDGACHVHEKFSVEKIMQLKAEHPDAPVLVHPECRPQVRLLADVIGSTAVLLKFATESDATEFIVATESGILHEMQKKCPGKTFIPAPADDSTCACNECSYMKLNTLEKLRDCLRDLEPQIHVDETIIDRARRPIERMLSLS